MSSAQSCALVVVMCGRGRRRARALGTHGHCSAVALNYRHRRRMGVLSPRRRRVGDLCVRGRYRARTRGPRLRTEALGLHRRRRRALCTHRCRVGALRAPLRCRVWVLSSCRHHAGVLWNPCATTTTRAVRLRRRRRAEARGPVNCRGGGRVPASSSSRRDFGAASSSRGVSGPALSSRGGSVPASLSPHGVVTAASPCGGSVKPVHDDDDMGCVPALSSPRELSGRVRIISQKEEKKGDVHADLSMSRIDFLSRNFGHVLPSHRKCSEDEVKVGCDDDDDDAGTQPTSSSSRKGSTEPPRGHRTLT